MTPRWLLLTTDFRPMKGGIARLIGWVVEGSAADVEWRCVTIVAGPAEPGVFRYGSFGSLFRSIPEHVRWLRQSEERQVVCAHAYLQPAALAAARGGRARLATFVYGTEIVPKQARHHAAIALLRFSDRVIADSRYAAAETAVVAGIAQDRLVVVHPRFRSPWQRSGPPARRRAGAGLHLVTVSRLLDIHKNLELAIRAVSVLARTGLVERYTIVGDGPQRPALDELAVALGVGELVELAGSLDDVAAAEVLASCHLGLFPSRRVDNYWEGFGMVVHELAGAGLPVLVGASGGTPDACPGDWSILLDPDDLGAWVGAIERLAAGEDERFRLAREAYEWSAGVDTAATVRDYVAAISGP